MHTRYARAAVATVTEPNTCHPTESPDRYRRSNTPPPSVLWATRPMAVGRDCTVAVMLREERLFVRVIDGKTGLSKWVPAEGALTGAQVDRWLESARFCRG